MEGIKLDMELLLNIKADPQAEQYCTIASDANRKHGLNNNDPFELLLLATYAEALADRMQDGAEKEHQKALKKGYYAYIARLMPTYDTKQIRKDFAKINEAAKAAGVTPSVNDIIVGLGMQNVKGRCGWLCRDEEDEEDYNLQGGTTPTVMLSMTYKVPGGQTKKGQAIMKDETYKFHEKRTEGYVQGKDFLPKPGKNKAGKTIRKPEPFELFNKPTGGTMELIKKINDKGKDKDGNETQPLVFSSPTNKCPKCGTQTSIRDTAPFIEMCTKPGCGWSSAPIMQTANAAADAINKKMEESLAGETTPFDVVCSMCGKHTTKALAGASIIEVAKFNEDEVKQQTVLLSAALGKEWTDGMSFCAECAKKFGDTLDSVRYEAMLQRDINETEAELQFAKNKLTEVEEARNAVTTAQAGQSTEEMKKLMQGAVDAVNEQFNLQSATVNTINIKLADLKKEKTSLAAGVTVPGTKNSSAGQSNIKANPNAKGKAVTVPAKVMPNGIRLVQKGQESAPVQQAKGLPTPKGTPPVQHNDGLNRRERKAAAKAAARAKK